MSSLLVHLSFGLLVCLALRLDRREILVGVLATEGPDIDHLFSTVGRGIGHSVWFIVVIPAAASILAVLAHNLPLAWRRLLSFAPVFTLSHLALDLVPLPTERNAPAALTGVPWLAPFDGRLYQFQPLVDSALRTETLVPLGMASAALAILVVAARHQWRWMVDARRPQAARTGLALVVPSLVLVGFAAATFFGGLVPVS